MERLKDKKFIFGILLSVILIFSTIFGVLSKTSIAYGEDNKKLFFPTDKSGNRIEKEADVKDEGEGMFVIDMKSFENLQKLSQWLQHNRTYLMVEPSSDGNAKNTSYYFNMPNISQLVHNFLYQLNPGGFFGMPYQKQWYQTTPDKQQTTALKKYSYELPIGYCYAGEYPVILYDITELKNGFMANPGNFVSIIVGGAENILDGIKKFVFGGDDLFKDKPKIEFNKTDIKTIIIKNQDYQDTSKENQEEIFKWLEKNFMKVMLNAEDQAWEGDWWAGIAQRWERWTGGMSVKINNEDMFKSGVIIKDDEYVGDHDIPGSKHKRISGKELYNRMVAKAGGNASQALGGLVDYGLKIKRAEKGVNTNVIRHLPYDLQTMSPASQEYMNGISDPRVDYYKSAGGLLGIIGTFIRNIVNIFVVSILLTPAKFLLCWAGMLNNICSFSWLDSMGVDIFLGWKGSVGQFVTICLAILGAGILIVSAIRIFLAKESFHKIIVRCVCILALSWLAIGFMSNPEGTGKAITDITNKVMNLGTIALEENDAFAQLHTDNATGAEKAELKYWATYFNLWSNYATGHTSADDANKWDAGSGLREYEHGFSESPAVLEGGAKHMNRWNVALVESLSNNVTSDALRSIDHYCAPTITPTGEKSFDTKVNQYWNGVYPYSQLPFGAFFIALTIFLITILKVLCFFELAIDVALLFIRLLSGAVIGKGRIKEELKAILMDVMRVVVYDIIITMVMWLTFTLDNNALFFGGVMFLGATIWYIWWILFKNTTFVLRPAMFKWIANAFRWVKKQFTKGAQVVKAAVKAATGNYVGAAADIAKAHQISKDNSMYEKGDPKKARNDAPLAGNGNRKDSKLTNAKNKAVGAVKDKLGKTGAGRKVMSAASRTKNVAAGVGNKAKLAGKIGGAVLKNSTIGKVASTAKAVGKIASAAGGAAKAQGNIIKNTTKVSAMASASGALGKVAGIAKQAAIGI